MKKIVISFLFVLLTFVNAATADTFEVEKPTADIPPECAAFSEEKGWFGKWDGIVPNSLWVQKITKNSEGCTMTAVYAWEASNPGPKASGSKKVVGVLRNGRITFLLNKNGDTTATYFFDGTELHGVFEKAEGGSMVSRKIVMRRGGT